MHRANHADRANRAHDRSRLHRLCLLAGLVAAAFAPPAVAAGFTAGNVVVYRVGDGSSSLGSTGAAVFLDEYTLAGALVQSLPLPTAANGSNQPLSAAGSASSEGMLSRSSNGECLLLTGYAAVPGTTGLAATTSASVQRVVGVVGSDGSVDTRSVLGTGSSGSFSATNPRGVASDDCRRAWITGGKDGVIYLPGLGATPTVVANATTNLRSVVIADGQLYISTASGSVRIASVGTGLPTAAASAITNLAGISSTASDPAYVNGPYGFALLDADSSTPGVDTLYVADNGANLVRRFSFSAGSWVASGSVALSGVVGLTAGVNGNTATLLASSGSKLYSLSDTNAGGASASFSTPAVLASAASNTAFRGVAFAPAATTVKPTVQLSASTAQASEAGMTVITLSATLSAPAVLDQTVSVQVGGVQIDASDYALSSAVITVPAGQLSASVSFTVLDDAAEEGEEVATLTLQHPSSGLTLGADKSVSITIADNDDTTAPTVSSVAVPAAATYTAGQVLRFTLNWSEPVTINGSPYLQLDVGGTARQATLLDGSISSTHHFDYTVAEGDVDSDGLALLSLSGNAATLVDAAGNAANLTLQQIGSLAGVQVNSSLGLPVLAPPVVLDATSESAEISVSSSLAGMAYYVVLPAGAVPPSAAQVLAGQDATGGSALRAGQLAVAKDQSAKLVINGLAADTAYKVYIVVKSGGVSSAVAAATLATTPTITRIHQIQGSGAASPLANQVVSVEAIVTGVFKGTGSLQGFYLQEEDADTDADPLSSEGLFVYTGASMPALSKGDKVRVTGKVVEFNGLTELTNTPALVISVLAQGQALPKATSLTLPVANLADWERYEGMRLQFSQTLTVSNNFELGQYGKVTLSSGGRLLQPTNVLDPNDADPSGTSSSGNSNKAAIEAMANANLRRAIVLDDGFSKQYPDPVPYIEASSNSLRLGSTVSQLSGVLHYGNNVYALQPSDGAPAFNYAARPAAPDLAGADLRVAATNVLNYFTTLTANNKNARGADSAAEFSRQNAKIVAELQGINADVLGLMELENIDQGAQDVLLGKLNAAVGAGSYARLEDGIAAYPASDAIKVGMFYKPAVVQPDGKPSLLADAMFERPSLAQVFVHKASGKRFMAVMNHLKSKSCGSAKGLDADQGDGQGCYTEKRREQAKRLAAWLVTLRQQSGLDEVILLGDFNAYAEEDPIDILRAAGYQLQHAATESYQFGGLTGSLDHALATPALASKIVGVAHWNVNADEPVFLDYNLEDKSPAQQAGLYQPNAYRSSDHDPVIVGLKLGTDVAPPTPSNPFNGGVTEQPNPTSLLGVAGTPATADTLDNAGALAGEVGIADNGSLVVLSPPKGPVVFSRSAPDNIVLSLPAKAPVALSVAGGLVTLETNPESDSSKRDTLLATASFPRDDGSVQQGVRLLLGQAYATAGSMGALLGGMSLSADGAGPLLTVQAGSSAAKAGMQRSADGQAAVSAEQGEIRLNMPASARAGSLDRSTSTRLTMALQAGEVARFDALGKLTGIYLGSVSGSAGKVGDTFVLQRPAGVTDYPWQLPRLKGSNLPARTGSLIDGLSKALGASIVQRADGVVEVNVGTERYRAFFTDRFEIVPGASDAFAVQDDGGYLLTVAGVRYRIYPALDDVPGLLTTLPGASLTVGQTGLLRIYHQGMSYMAQPALTLTAATPAGAPAITTENGVFQLLSASGQRQQLLPTWFDRAELAAAARKLGWQLMLFGETTTLLDPSGKRWQARPDYGFGYTYPVQATDLGHGFLLSPQHQLLFRFSNPNYLPAYQRFEILP
ncbi:ExeM/NucH family extracellular endonuclease [Chitinimonas prasina]|uniref:ExeM/NucH family extracellular endonuclease n=1 Tax=Chitinimonas prasina TaxID=1434937 RepID=UPI0024E0CDBE|nr:ExeM/NucH family extracellular endonuclease [Chitinimonas prasina]